MDPLQPTYNPSNVRARPPPSSQHQQIENTTSRHPLCTFPAPTSSVAPLDRVAVVLNNLSLDHHRIACLSSSELSFGFSGASLVQIERTAIINHHRQRASAVPVYETIKKNACFFVNSLDRNVNTPTELGRNNY